MEIHDSIDSRRDKQASTLTNLLLDEALFALDDPFAHLDHLRVVHRKLLEPHHRLDDQCVRVTRQRLAILMVDEAEALSVASDAQRCHGWNRLMLIYVIYCQLLVREDASSLAIDYAQLAQRQLLCFGAQSPLAFSMHQLGIAINVFRCRLVKMHSSDTSVLYYLRTLELRAAHFVMNIAAHEDFDVPSWRWCRDDDRWTCDRNFTVTMAFSFLWIRRYIHSYMHTVFGVYFATDSVSRHCARIDAKTTAALLFDRRTSNISVDAMREFVMKRAQNMSSVEYMTKFREVMRSYDILPGDIDIHSQIYGRGGQERAIVQEVIVRDFPGAAASYVAYDKYEHRSIADWVSVNDQVSGFGVADESFLNQVATLHVFAAFMLARFGIRFSRDYIVNHRHDTYGHFTLALQKAVNAERPFIVQLLGSFACCVPTTGSTMTLAEMEVRLAKVEVGDGEPPPSLLCRMYECGSAVNALTLWAAFTLIGWCGLLSDNRTHAQLLSTLCALKV